MFAGENVLKEKFAAYLKHIIPNNIDCSKSIFPYLLGTDRFYWLSLRPHPRESGHVWNHIFFTLDVVLNHAGVRFQKDAVSVSGSNGQWKTRNFTRLFTVPYFLVRSSRVSNPTRRRGCYVTNPAACPLPPPPPTPRHIWNQDDAHYSRALDIDDHTEKQGVGDRQSHAEITKISKGLRRVPLPTSKSLTSGVWSNTIHSGSDLSCAIVSPLSNLMWSISPSPVTTPL